ncbi:MAG: hypothetical protein QNJ97_14875 [Myxococcota bacterium]|nr:hypothetical protein [Myxococcota bacterium]
MTKADFTEQVHETITGLTKKQAAQVEDTVRGTDIGSAIPILCKI